MYKITGKQQFGAVWENGECLAVFNRGTAYTNDTTKADLLREKGYTVEGSSDLMEPPATEGETTTTNTSPDDEPTEGENATTDINQDKPTRKRKGE